MKLIRQIEQYQPGNEQEERDKKLILALFEISGKYFFQGKCPGAYDSFGLGCK